MSFKLTHIAWCPSQIAFDIVAYFQMSSRNFVDDIAKENSATIDSNRMRGYETML